MMNMGHGSTLYSSSLTWARRRPHYQSVFQKSEHIVRIPAPVNNVGLVPRDVPQHYPTKEWLCFELLQEERLVLQLSSVKDSFFNVFETLQLKTVKTKKINSL